MMTMRRAATISGPPIPYPPSLPLPTGGSSSWTASGGGLGGGSGSKHLANPSLDRSGTLTSLRSLGGTTNGTASPQGTVGGGERLSNASLMDEGALCGAWGLCRERESVCVYLI